MTFYTATRFRSLLAGVGIATLLAAGIGSGVQAQGTHTKMQASHSHAKISAAQAQTIALKKYPGKVEGKTNLENEEGSWQYAVNVRSGKTLREVQVDAMTGKIANVEVTSKAEEAKEQKAEAAKMKSAHTVSKDKKPK
jgi:hypothetical protein